MNNNGHYLFCVFIILLIAIPLNGVDSLIGFNIHVIILGVCFLLWMFNGTPTNNLTSKYVIVKILFFIAYFLSSYKFQKVNYYGVSMGYVQEIMMIVLLCQVSKEKDYIHYLQAFVLGALLNGILIFFGSFLGMQILHWGGDDEMRMTILGRDPNEMAMVHCFAIAMSLYLMRINKLKIWRNIYVASAILCVASILFTGSRTATVAVELLILINFLIARKKIGGFVSGLVVTTLLMFSVFFVSVYFLEDSILERYTTMTTEVEEGTMANRTLIWNDCIKTFVNADGVNMLIGHGYNTTSLYTLRGYDAHNVFLKVLVEYGIVGEILFLLLWYYFIKSALRLKDRDDKFLSLSLLSMIFISFQTLSWMYNILVWIVVILIHFKIKYFGQLERKQIAK